VGFADWKGGPPDCTRLATDVQVLFSAIRKVLAAAYERKKHQPHFTQYSREEQTLICYAQPHLDRVAAIESNALGQTFRFSDSGEVSKPYASVLHRPYELARRTRQSELLPE